MKGFEDSNRVQRNSRHDKENIDYKPNEFDDSSTHFKSLQKLYSAQQSNNKPTDVG